MAVLDWGKVEDIRVRWEGGETQSSLSVSFGVSLNTIGKIVKGQSWVNVQKTPRVAGRGERRLEDPEEILQRMLALQETVNRRGSAELPPASLLDGGDASSVSGGLDKLQHVQQEMRDEGTL